MQKEQAFVPGRAACVAAASIDVISEQGVNGFSCQHRTSEHHRPMSYLCQIVVCGKSVSADSRQLLQNAGHKSTAACGSSDHAPVHDIYIAFFGS